jgi:glycosyltransferase involved in cell wall biosynthesis
LVSVIVAAHDAVATIGYAITSLLEQSYENLEILVGDDASRDGTLLLLQSRFGSEPRVRLFRSVRNQGAYNLRNALAVHARGALLTFHDADDFALPNRIARQVAQLEKPRVGACVGNFVRIKPNGSFVFFKDQRASRMCPVSLMLPRSIFDEVGPFRSARFGADYELFTELRRRLGAERVRRIREPLLFGLAFGGSATRMPGTESLEDGYRSPARRTYSELVFAKRQLGGRLTNEEIDVRLRESDNYQTPSELLKA